MTFRTIVAALVLALTPVAVQASGRPVQPEDLFHLRYVGAPQISPNGKYVVYVVSTMNGPLDRYDTNLWLSDTVSGATRRLTSSGHDGGPAWSPDSTHFAFVRGAAKAKPQIYVYDMRTGRIRRLTRVKSGASGPLYSHGGKVIAFSSTTTDPQPKAQIDFAAAGFTPKKSQRTSDVGRIDTMHFQANGAGEVYREHQHIWMVNSDGSNPHALTTGHAWSENGYAFSPDDAAIAFNSLRHDDPYGGPADIYTIPVRGGAMRKMPSASPANNLIGYGRTGDRLWYFRSGDRDPDEYPSLVSSSADGSNMRTVVGSNAISWGDSLLADMKEGGGLCFNVLPGDTSVILNVDGPGFSKLVRMRASDGSMTDLTGSNGEAYGCSVSADGKTVAYSFSDFTHPPEIYILPAAGGTPRALTSFNAAYLRGVTLSHPQPIVVRDAAGYDVQAWFMPAVGPRAVGKRPTILNIHGGPSTQFGNTFFHELQYYAGQGYNVVFSDPRGSTGHGYPFQEALVHHWGDAMLDDTNLVMDAAIRRPDVDASRLAVTGGSYGGYAVLWTISHTSRYKAAVAERVVSNLMSEQLVADFASTNGLGGPYDWGMPWDPNNTLMAQSPLTYADRVHTPVLILHGTEDTRTPIDQTLQEFSALKILGRTVQYVEFPGENHDLSRTGSPIHRVERLHVMGNWLRKYLHP